MRPSGVFKTENEYQKMIDRKLYEDTPKAVFAALVVSYLDRLAGGDAHDIDSEILDEWRILNLNGIVPQKPPKFQKNNDYTYDTDNIPTAAGHGYGY